MYLLKCKGHKAHGIEPNQGYANHAIEQYGVDIQVGCFEDIDFKEKSYDVILLFHVLEHLENPVEDIKRLKRFLKENGTFIIEVPNVTHRQGFPTAKWHIGHLYNFNKTTLAATAAKAGLCVEQVSEMGRGGYLFGVFTNLKPQAKISLEGNFDRVHRTLESHTAAKHLTTIHPYTRLLSRAYNSIREKWAIQKFSNGRETLDTLYAESH